MSDGQTRIEKDSMGEMPVPAKALYGASTQRAVLNFPISGRAVPEAVIRAYAVLKAACAGANKDLGLLDERRATDISDACALIEAGLPDHGGLAPHFPDWKMSTGK
ncbi:MAG: aspartate ammonia-lyase, partial [Planctomycetota bacterium]